MTSVPAGWTTWEKTAFDRFVGPFYQLSTGEANRCGFLGGDQHTNTRGDVHGGMILACFDFAMGVACRAAAGQVPCATVQLNVQFVGPLRPGEFAVVQSEIVRLTRSIVFLRATMSVEERMVATADGVWKILKSREDPKPE